MPISSVAADLGGVETPRHFQRVVHLLQPLALSTFTNFIPRTRPKLTGVMVHAAAFLQARCNIRSRNMQRPTCGLSAIGRDDATLQLRNPLKMHDRTIPIPGWARALIPAKVSGIKPCNFLRL